MKINKLKNNSNELIMEITFSKQDEAIFLTDMTDICDWLTVFCETTKNRVARQLINSAFNDNDKSVTFSSPLIKKEAWEKIPVGMMSINRLSETLYNQVLDKAKILSAKERNIEKVKGKF